MRAVNVHHRILPVHDNFHAPKDARQRAPQWSSRAGCAIGDAILNADNRAQKNPVTVKLDSLPHPRRIEGRGKATPHHCGRGGVHHTGHGFFSVRVSDQARQDQNLPFTNLS